MRPTSTKHRSGAAAAVLAESDPAGAVDRARRRIQGRYYDRPEVRRTLATLLLHRAARGTLAPNGDPRKTP